MIKNNEKTEMAINRILLEDPAAWEEELFENTDYALQLEGRNPVLEGVVERLHFLGCDFGEMDTKQIIRELNRRYKEIGEEEGIPRSVKNWINGAALPDPNNRQNLYNLCLALGMSVDDTRVFFLKNYMTIPFNYKNRIDLIYYWGIKHELSYPEICALIDEFHNKKDVITNKFESTQMIGDYVAEIDDISIFREYLVNNSYGIERQYETASKEIERLKVKDASYAEIERSIKDELNKKRENEKGVILDETKIIRENGTVNIRALLYVIYCYDNQNLYSERERHHSIAKCQALPNAFRKNFPNDQEFSQIESKKAKADVYRKTLIILNFYNFFCSNMFSFMYDTDTPTMDQEEYRSIYDYQERPKDEIKSDLMDFYDEMGVLLAKCGFEQMYARNPFDWLILYCANSTLPLDTFRELLASRFLEKED